MQRQDLIDMAQFHYFENVDQWDIEKVLDCFHEDAVVTVNSAEPAKHEGKDAIRGMFEELFKNFPNKMMHKDFRHVVDEENNAIASQFNVELMSVNNDEIFQTNSNFFYLEDGKFKDVTVYMLGQNVLKG